MNLIIPRLCRFCTCRSLTASWKMYTDPSCPNNDTGIPNSVSWFPDCTVTTGLVPVVCEDLKAGVRVLCRNPVKELRLESGLLVLVSCV